MPSAPPAPPERNYANGAPPVVSEKHERYETLSLTLAANATFQEVGRFSGTPDAIDIWASAANLNVRLSDLAVVEVSVVKTEANQTLHTNISRRLVEVQDPAGTGTQSVYVTGKWAEPRAK